MSQNINNPEKKSNATKVTMDPLSDNTFQPPSQLNQLSLQFSNAFDNQPEYTREDSHKTVPLSPLNSNFEKNRRADKKKRHDKRRKQNQQEKENIMMSNQNSEKWQNNNFGNKQTDSAKKAPKRSLAIDSESLTREGFIQTKISSGLENDTLNQQKTQFNCPVNTMQETKYQSVKALNLGNDNHSSFHSIQNSTDAFKHSGDLRELWGNKPNLINQHNIQIDHEAMNESNPPQAVENNNTLNPDTLSRTVSSPTNALLNQNAINLRPEAETSNQQREEPITGQQLSLFQGELSLRRYIAFFVATGCISGFMTFTARSLLPYQWVCRAVLLYWLYVIIERIISRRKIQRLAEPWIATEDILTALDAGCGIATLVILNLKISDVISSSSFAPLPFLVTSLFYLCKSKAPAALKKQRSFLKLFYTFQVLLIGLKLDATISSDWEFIFMGCWAYALIIGAYFALNASFLTLIVLVMMFRRHQFRICKEELVGLFWNCLLAARTLSDFIVIMGIIRAYGPHNDFELLKIGAYVNLGLSVLGVLYAIIIYDTLAKHLGALLTRSSTEEEEVEIESESNKQIVTLEKEKKETYFVKVSSTYYLPLDSGLSIKNRENIQRIKNIFSSLKQEKGSNKSDNLKRLDETLPNKSVLKSNQILMTTRDWIADSENKMENNEFERHYMSADNIDKIQEDELTIQKSPDETQCYLCYDQENNAVLMNCGHGGICYECAIAIAKSKYECMECRAPIKEVHKIDANPKFLDIVKGFEVCKVVLKREEVEYS